MAASFQSASLELLTNDCEALGKLLKRNANQHGGSRLFGYLKRAYKTCSTYLQETDVAAVEVSGTSLLRRKVSNISGDMSTCNTVLRHHENVVRSCAEVIMCSLKAYALLQQQLKKKIYVPLFTILLAVSSRQAVLAAKLHSYFTSQTELLFSHCKSLKLRRGAIIAREAKGKYASTELVQQLLQNSADSALGGSVSGRGVSKEGVIEGREILDIPMIDEDEIIQTAASKAVPNMPITVANEATAVPMKATKAKKLKKEKEKSETTSLAVPVSMFAFSTSSVSSKRSADRIKDSLPKKKKKRKGEKATTVTEEGTGGDAIDDIFG